MRCFLALELPQHIRSQLVLQQFLMPVKRRVAPENFHLTLVFLGDADNPMLDALDQELSRLDSPMPQVALHGLGLFGKDKAHNLHARALPDPSLMALHDRLTRLARNVGFAPEKRRYSPHVTLAYLRPDMFEQSELELAVARSADFRTDPFEAQEVTLFRSHLRPDGAEYDVLERYPLSPSLRALNW
jgi:2'-5' RNA ligase